MKHGPRYEKVMLCYQITNNQTPPIPQSRTTMFSTPYTSRKQTTEKDQMGIRLLHTVHSEEKVRPPPLVSITLSRQLGIAIGL